MHLKRWLTGIIALPILVLLVVPGPKFHSCSLFFYILLYVANLVALSEFYEMTTADLPRFMRWNSYFFTLLLFAAIYYRQALMVPVMISFMAFVAISYFVISHPFPNSELTSKIGKTVMAPVYVSLPLAMLVHIHQFYPGGNLWVLFLFAVVFGSDTGAFYIGRLFGKHKLHEKVSPGKTWEGMAGGLISSVIVAAFFLKISRLHSLDVHMYILALLLSAVGQMGDLAESLLKRNHGVKDSGWILPGHGGILDRIDGLLFAAPLLYFYLSFRLT